MEVARTETVPKAIHAGIWQRIWRLKKGCKVKVYHGYGDEDGILLLGSVLAQWPNEQTHFRRSFWKNAVNLLRFFMVKAHANQKVSLSFNETYIEATTDANGFFKFQCDINSKLPAGWHNIEVMVADGAFEGIKGEGKLYHPHTNRFGIVSDIDDTFLVSHSSKILRRVLVLFTKNARTRKPFEGVVKHYQALAQLNTHPHAPNPFFYVSSSEWNLYDYIKEFCRFHQLPEGVFLLSSIKQVGTLLKTGQGKHSDKYDRIVLVLNQYPHTNFVLLGDDSQQDPFIYIKVVETFPGRVLAVYLRRRVEKHSTAVEKVIARLDALQVPSCYFYHSSEALEHSRSLGLTDPMA